MAKSRIIRRSLEHIRRSGGRIDHAKVAATTEEDMRQQMIEDGEDPDAEIRATDIYLAIGHPAAALMVVLAREPDAALRALKPRAA